MTTYKLTNLINLWQLVIVRGYNFYSVIDYAKEHYGNVQVTQCRSTNQAMLLKLGNR